jgi:hypothetical protein
VVTGGGSQPRRVGTGRAPEENAERRRVEVPVAVLATLASALLVALLAVAYLAGREAGRSRQAAPLAGPTPLASTGTPSPTPTPAPTTESPPPLAEGTPPTAGGWFPEPEPETEDLPVDGQGEAVVRYFETLESFEAQAEYWDDPQELATSLMSEMTTGDSSGFDRLVEAQRQAERGLVSMEVPAPCREHHDRTLALLREAVGLLTSVRSGVVAGDVQAVMAAATRARSLETEARELESLAQALKERYQIPD